MEASCLTLKLTPSPSSILETLNTCINTCNEVTYMYISNAKRVYMTIVESIHVVRINSTTTCDDVAKTPQP
jgi:hypothetical protein